MIHFFCSQVALAVCPPLTSSSSSFSSHGTSLRTRRERRRESELSQSFSSSSSSHLHPSHPFLLPFKKRLLKGAACEGDGAFLHLPAPSINKREGHAHHRHPPWRREEGIEKKKKRGLSTNSSSSSTRFDDKMDGVCKEIFAKGRRGLHSGEGGPYRKSERRREAWRDCPASSSSSSSSSLVFFGSSISFLNGLHDVLQYVVDRAALGGSSAGGTAGGEPQSAGALLPFFDIFGWASSHVNGDVDPFHKDSSSMNEEQQRVMASVTLLLPTILVACVAAVGATLRRHFHRPHLPSCSSSRFSSSCLVKASWRRQRGEEERSARSEERSSRRNEESQSNGTNVRREGDILDGSSYSSDHATRLSDREKRTESSSSSSSVPLKKNGAPRSFDPLDIERREISGRSSPAYIRSAETRGEGGEQGGEQGEGEGHHDRRTWLDEGSRSRRGREREGKRRERKEQGESHGGSRTRGEEEGGGGGGLGVADLDATRNEEAVRLKVTEVMEVLFKSFPRQFVQSCLAVWGLALNGDREKIGALLFILKQMPSAVL
ncbi:n-terminal domain-containing protein, partial [Cystoisospora suis]